MRNSLARMCGLMNGMRSLGLVGLLVLGAMSPVAAQEDLARLLHYPHAEGDTLVFVRGGDIWRVPLQGGIAVRLTSHEGLELFPKISPDGTQVAFSAEYSGTRQVYVMPITGGMPKQLTYYSDVGVMPPRGGFDNWVMGWTSDSQILVRMNRTPFGKRVGKYFLVDPKGGLEKPLNLPHGGSASLNQDGRRLAYTPIDREFRTWKRTRGGRAQDLWLYDLLENRSTQLTTFPGTDSHPMWIGDRLFFLSDRNKTLNLFELDFHGQDHAAVTGFTDYDVLWPAVGSSGIVFSQAGYIWHWHPDQQAPRRIDIRIQDDRVGRMPTWKDLSKSVESAVLDAEGQHVHLVARGDMFRVPVEGGAIAHAAATPDARESQVRFSKDGKVRVHVVATGVGQRIHVQRTEAEDFVIDLERPTTINRMALDPKGTALAVQTQDRVLEVIDLGDQGVTARHTILAGRELVGGAVSWSPDSQWLAYTRSGDRQVVQIALWNRQRNESFTLGDGLTHDTNPCFASDGVHLFFTSNRDYRLTFSAYEFNYVYTDAGDLFVAALDPDAKPLFPVLNGEASSFEMPEGDEPPGTGDIGPEGFTQRTMRVPGVEGGRFGNLDCREGHLYYSVRRESGSAACRYDIGEREEKKVVEGAFGYDLSGDGKKLLARDKGVWTVRSSGGGDEKTLDLSSLKVRIDPTVEWGQMFDEAWRIARDWFYDRNMHGKDWAAIGERYRALLPHVSHRSDLDFLLGEMIGELESGHTYVQSGDVDRVERVQGGKLGCELKADASAGMYRISKVLHGENWNDAWRCPLEGPGVQVSVGEYLLAIDGTELSIKDNPYRLLEGKANVPVTLTLTNGSRDQHRKIVVKTIASEQNLRYLNWVRGNIEMVDRLSGGRIGYIHLPNTAGEGNRMLQKLFLPQVHKEALIFDDRYNGGGFIPDRMIEMMARRTEMWWARRDRFPMKTPGIAHDGPKAMLINGYSSSGGDALPYLFKKNGLGSLIGTRTWGGLIGLSGNPSLVDGGSVEIPTFRVYDDRGEWIIENHGVEPDLEVVDLPEKLNEGTDPCIEAAVRDLMSKLKSAEPAPPREPKPPIMR